MSTKRTPAPGDTPEGAAPEPVRAAGPAAVESLDDLAAMARTIDTPAPAGPVVDPAAAAEAERRAREASIAATTRDFTELLQVARAAVEPLIEQGGALKPGQVAAIWNDAALQRIAYPLATLAHRYGLGANEIMEQYGPWLMLAAGIGLPGFATVKAIKENRQAQAQPAPAVA